MDKITINKLKIFCNHGVYDYEKENGQNFYVSATLYLDTYLAGLDDNLDASVNYAGLCYKINSFMTQNTFDLIETVAEKLAAYILNEYILIKELELTIHKPEAPIGLPFKDVSVTIHRAWKKAYISFGSNMGDSKEIIDNAINTMHKDNGIRIIKQSDIIKTTSYGGVEQDDFLNGCLEIETFYNPFRLLEFLHSIENAAGRVRTIHWGPRTLDLDILLYDNMIINSEKLTIPHPDMQNRTFVLEPLCEIAPYAYNPIYNKTAIQMLNDLRKKNI